MPTYLTPGVYVEEIRDHPGSIDGVRMSTTRFVEQSLGRSQAFVALDTPGRIAIGDAMIRILTAILTSSPQRAEPAPTDIVLATVDFPDFVAGLVHGTFDAIVDASIEQLQAFGELLASVARSIDEFAEETVSEAQARDLLVRALLAGVAASSSCEPR